MPFFSELRSISQCHLPTKSGKLQVKRAVCVCVKMGGTCSLEQRGQADLLAFLSPHDRFVPALPTVWRVHPQVDGNWGDAFVGPRDPVGLRFDLLSNFIKVCKLFGLAVQKLGIFCKGKEGAQKEKEKRSCSRWVADSLVEQALCK